MIIIYFIFYLASNQGSHFRPEAQYSPPVSKRHKKKSSSSRKLEESDEEEGNDDQDGKFIIVIVIIIIMVLKFNDNFCVIDIGPRLSSRTGVL